VVAQAGAVGAATDEFFVEIVGRGGHGARPHLGRDPVVAGSALVTALQTVVSRRIDPGAPAVLTVATFRAGSAPNVIPQNASISGTLRAMDPETRAQLSDELEGIVHGIEVTYGVSAELEVRHGTPAVINDTKAAGWAQRAATKLLGPGALRPLGAVNMGGEDFAFYLERIPGCFLRIGAREPGGELLGAHTPRFLAAEESIAVGSAVLAGCARQASTALASGA
jgi:hippurate hydrolase